MNIHDPGNDGGITEGYHDIIISSRKMQGLNQLNSSDAFRLLKVSCWDKDSDIGIKMV